MDKNLALLPEIFYRRRIPALATFISVLCGAIAYLAFTPRLYEAKVRLMLDDKQVGISELGRNLTSQSNIAGANPIATQAELARSQRVLQKALAQLPAKTKVGKPSDRLTANSLKTKLKTTIIPATRLLELSYRSKDPVLSARVLNAVTAAMVEENTATIRSEAGSARKFLEAEVPQKRGELAQAEASLSVYKRSQGLVSLTDSNGQDNAQTRSLIASLTTLEDQEREISAGLQEAKQRNQSLKKVTDSSTLKNTYAAVRSGQAQEIQNLRDKLVNLESQLALERSRFTDNNPSVLNLREERDAVRSLYQQKLASIAPNNTPNNSAGVASDRVSQDLATNLIVGEINISAQEKKLAAIRGDRAKLQARLDRLPVKEQALAGLMRQRQEAADSLQFLQRKLEEARIAEAQQVSNLSIVDLAEPPERATWPKIPVVLAIATVGGLTLAVGVVLIIELFDDKLRNATEVETLVKLPVLGVLPVLPQASLTLDRPEAFLRDCAALESYRSLLTSLKFRNLDRLKTVVVSSTLAEEGKSSLVSHLGAVSATLSKRTLIIDADLRRPKQHKLFNVSERPGLTDVVNGDISLKDAVQQTSIQNLSVLTCGEPQLYPSQFFESKQMRTTLAEAALLYDFVIIDTPPVTSCVDAVTLSRDSDGMVLVARPNFTQKDIFSRAVSELHNNRINVLGVAINGITDETERFYRYGLQGYQPLDRKSLEG
jgi:capsular exopolysaccharide synthesis family protein